MARFQKKTGVVLLLCVLCLSLFGCGKSNEGDVTINSDTGSVTVSIKDSMMDYTVSKGKKDTFVVKGSMGTVTGELMSETEANSLSASEYGKDSYTSITIGGAPGFAYAKDDIYYHVFQPENMTDYVVLSAENSDGVIYEVEEALQFEGSQTEADKKIDLKAEEDTETTDED